MPFKCMKIKPKRRIKMVLPALREENLAKIEEENDKKFVVLPCQVGERRKVWKELLKKGLNQSKSSF